MLMTGLIAGFVLGLVLMAALGFVAWERGFRAGNGERQARDRGVRERMAGRYLGRVA